MAPDGRREKQPMTEVLLPAYTFDEILEEAGEIGRWQIFMLLIISSTTLAFGFQATVAPFIAEVPDHWCAVEQLSALTSDQQKNYSIPYDEKEKEYSSCKVYVGRDYDLVRYLNDEGNLTRLPHTFYQAGEEVDCPGQYRFDRREGGETIVSEWNLVCSDAWLAATAQAAFMLGYFLGCPSFGALADKKGRRPVLLLCAGICTVSAIVTAMLPNFWVYAAFRVITGATCAGAYNSGYVYLIENVGLRYRNRFTFLGSLFFALGYSLNPLLAWLLPEWRHLQVAVSAWMFFQIVFYFVVPESPRWLYAEGRLKECKKVIRRVARFNGHKLLADFQLKTERKTHMIVTSSGKTREPHIIDVVRTPNMMKKSLVLMYQWFVVSLVYYGLGLNAVNIGKNGYVSFFMGAIVEVPAYLLSMYVLMKCGRRLSVLATFLIGGVCCLATALPFTSELEWIMVTLATLGKFAVSMTFCMLYLYAGEVYPTVIRTVGIGSNSMFARLGGIGAPYINMLSSVARWLPLVIFGGLTLLAGMLTLLLPETKDQKLPETIDDGEAFGRNQKFWQFCPRQEESIDETEPD